MPPIPSTSHVRCIFQTFAWVMNPSTPLAAVNGLKSPEVHLFVKYEQHRSTVEFHFQGFSRSVSLPKSSLYVRHRFRGSQLASSEERLSCPAVRAGFTPENSRIISARCVMPPEVKHSVKNLNNSFQKAREQGWKNSQWMFFFSYVIPA